MMRVSDRGIEFIASWEGIRLHLYDDGGPGVGNATIGIGHLIHLGPIDGSPSEAPFKNGITQEQAFDLFRVDVRRFENVVEQMATIELNQNQFDAMVDFCFNTGGGYPQVWNAVNTKGDVCAVLVRTAILPAWATAALVRRRKAECALYTTPVEDEMGKIEIAPFWTDKRYGPGRWEINLLGDFGPAKAYDMRIVMASDSKGPMRFKHGDFNLAATIISGQRTSSFLLVPGIHGTAPFEVDDPVHFAYIACAGVIQ